MLTLSRSVCTSATWSLVTMQFPRADRRSSTRWMTTESGRAFRRCCSSWSVVVLGTSSPRLLPVCVDAGLVGWGDHVGGSRGVCQGIERVGCTERPAVAAQAGDGCLENNGRFSGSWDSNTHGPLYLWLDIKILRDKSASLLAAVIFDEGGRCSTILVYHQHCVQAAKEKVAKYLKKRFPAIKHA